MNSVQCDMRWLHSAQTSERDNRCPPKCNLNRKTICATVHLLRKTYVSPVLPSITGTVRYVKEGEKGHDTITTSNCGQILVLHQLLSAAEMCKCHCTLSENMSAFNYSYNHLLTFQNKICKIHKYYIPMEQLGANTSTSISQHEKRGHISLSPSDTF